MNNRILMTALFVAIAWLSSFGQSTAQYEDTKMFVVVTMTDGSLYAGQNICYTVKLYSTNPSIEFARPIRRADFSGLHQLKYPKAMTGRNSSVLKETYKGKEYFTVVLEDVMLRGTEAGTYTIHGAEYIIGVNEYSLYNDPFWGTVRRLQPAEYPVKVGDLKIKLKSLPSKAPETFSGAIGEFSVKSILPEGPITPRMEATVIFRIKGEGDLNNTQMPDVTSAFPKGVELKSVSQDLQVWQQGNHVMSELTLECTFVPEEEGDLVISPIKYTFFSPKAGRYVTEKSDAVFFTVKHPELPAKPPVIYEI